jgi:phosphoenolpyruvate phosphomutase
LNVFEGKSQSDSVAFRRSSGWSVGERVLSYDDRPRLGVGVHSGLTALLAAKHGFDFLWLSSFEASAAGGLPDAGLLDPSEIGRFVHAVRGLTDRPEVVDIDAGYGDAVKVHHVVRGLARAGAAAVCIEDNPTSKRSSLYAGYPRTLVGIPEHSERIRAARLATHEEEEPYCAVISRTEALVAGRPVEEALERATAYVEAGADAVFVQSCDPTAEEIFDFGVRWDRRTPLFVTPTRYPHLTARALFEAGATHVIFANHAIRAAYRAIDAVFGTLSRSACALAVEDEISSVDELSAPFVTRVKELEELVGINSPYAEPVLAQVGGPAGYRKEV